MRKLSLLITIIISLVITMSCTTEITEVNDSNLSTTNLYVWNPNKVIELEWVNYTKTHPWNNYMFVIQCYLQDTVAYPNIVIPANITHVIKSKNRAVRLLLKYTDEADSTKIRIYKYGSDVDQKEYLDEYQPYITVNNPGTGYTDSTKFSYKILNYKKLIYKK